MWRGNQTEGVQHEVLIKNGAKKKKRRRITGKTRKTPAWQIASASGSSTSSEQLPRTRRPKTRTHRRARTQSPVGERIRPPAAGAHVVGGRLSINRRDRSASVRTKPRAGRPSFQPLCSGVIRNVATQLFR